jgi:ubiquitin-protein ligase
MSRLFKKRIMNEIKMYSRDNFIFPNVLLKPDDSDLKNWYFLINGLDGDYTGGYYFGIIMLSEEYPLKPPDFKFYTPSGRFEVDKKICTSFTGFHGSEHAVSQNILTLSQGVISFMTDDTETGIGSITLRGSKTDGLEIRKRRIMYALNSMIWNSDNELFKGVFTESDLAKIM